MSSPVHLVHTPSTVPAPWIFTYGTSGEPWSSSHDSLVEIVTTKLNPTTRNNPPSPVTNVPSDPDSDSSSSYSSSSDSSYLSDDEYY